MKKSGENPKEDLKEKSYGNPQETIFEIGSIYEINPKILDEGKAIIEELELKEVHKYRKKNTSFAASGREGIALGLRSIEVQRPEIKKICLMPAYMCDTVFYPFVNAGWKLYFYHINKQLKADEEEIRLLIDRYNPELLFINCYYGVDTWKDMRPLFKEWQNNGLTIMEDVTQSYYLQGAGLEVDYVIGSLRKWYPIPDGGFVTSDFLLPEEELPVQYDFVEKRIETLTQKWRYLYESEHEADRKVIKENYLKRNVEEEEWLDHLTSIRGMSEISAKILSNQEESVYRNSRSKNYNLLYDKICHYESVRCVFSKEEQEIAPLYLPVYAEDRLGLQEYLKKQDIYAPVLWPIGKENAEYLLEDEWYIFNHLLALPIDQRYGAEAMKKIARTIDDYERKASFSIL